MAQDPPCAHSCRMCRMCQAASDEGARRSVCKCSGEVLPGLSGEVVPCSGEGSSGDPAPVAGPQCRCKWDFKQIQCVCVAWLLAPDRLLCLKARNGVTDSCDIVFDGGGADSVCDLHQQLLCNAIPQVTASCTQASAHQHQPHRTACPAQRNWPANRYAVVCSIYVEYDPRACIGWAVHTQRPAGQPQPCRGHHPAEVHRLIRSKPEVALVSSTTTTCSNITSRAYDPVGIHSWSP
jgi:hypothetical protein